MIHGMILHIFSFALLLFHLFVFPVSTSSCRHQSYILDPGPFFLCMTKNCLSSTIRMVSSASALAISKRSSKLSTNDSSEVFSAPVRFDDNFFRKFCHVLCNFSSLSTHRDSYRIGIRAYSQNIGTAFIVNLALCFAVSLTKRML